MASSTGGSLHTGGSTTYEATRERMSFPTINEDEVWTRITGDHKRGRIYGLIDFTTSGGACSKGSCCGGHRADVVAGVSELRKAYSDMYSFLMQMRSSESSAAAMPDMPPPHPPPPPTRSQSPPPQPDQGTGFPQPEDDPDYV
ncbi:hypothetical protein PIB30_056821 [Stylosanthes scabra]|uniref:Uncharacterized protein n=1 Tax=Stylosanthes scabra TaxID=79078 RepID=A0ABU6VHY4_9FABA|nr:hypothetical protein [Stylosanthes scabra]